MPTRVHLLPILLLVGCLPLSVVAQDRAARRAPPKIDAIDEAMQGFVDQGQIAGAVTLVARNGRLVHLSAVGMRDLENQRPMMPQSLFSIASMTKPITATAVMILQDEGKLRVDDPVSKYLPSFANVKLQNGEPPSRPITIRDVLTHTSGIPGEQVFTGSLADHVEQVATRPLAFEPGAKWLYSPGLSIAGRIVEVVSGQTFDQFLKERILDPLEMSSTTFYPNDRQQQRLARIYMPGEDGSTLVATDNYITDFRPANGPNPSGGLASNARNLFRFYQMILDGGRYEGKQIVSAESVKMMTSPQSGDVETGFTPGNCWGFGWCLVQEPQGVSGMLSPGTFGHGGAFGTQGWVDPKTGTIFVLLIQRTKMGNSDASEIRKTFQQLAVDSLR